MKIQLGTIQHLNQLSGAKSSTSLLPKPPVSMNLSRFIYLPTSQTIFSRSHVSSSRLLLSLPSDQFPKGFPNQSLSRLSPTMNSTFHRPNSTVWPAHTTKFLIIAYPKPPTCFSTFKTKTFPERFLNHCNLCFPSKQDTLFHTNAELWKWLCLIFNSLESNEGESSVEQNNKHFLDASLVFL